MTVNTFFNGVSPALWYSHILFNELFGTNLSPTSGLPQSDFQKASAKSSTSSQLDALNGLYYRQYDLLSKANKLSLTNETDSAFYQKTAESSDESVATVNYFNGNNYSGDIEDAEIEIDVVRVALAQINLGSNEVDPNAVTDPSLDPETSPQEDFLREIKITVNGTDYNYEFGIEAGETWATTLEKLRQGINGLGIGVTGAIVAQPSGNVKFQLTGETGAGNSFTVSDVQGDLVADLGLTNTIQTAQDALFTIDGQLYEQASPRAFLLDGKLEVEIQDTGQATITIEPDQAGATEAVQDVIEAMNSMSAYLASNSYLSSSLSTKWARLVERSAFLLSGYGVESDIDHSLSLDTSLLASQLEEDWTAVAEAFGGRSGLLADLKSFSERITGSPGASLLQDPPQSGYGYMYLRSMSSAPRFRVGSSSFWQVV